MSKEAAKDRFLNVFKEIVDELTGILVSYKMPKEAITWFQNNLNYNTPGGKLNRGLSVVDTYAILNNTTADKLDDETYRKVAILGWAIELLQAYFWLLMI